jgi:cysteine desulfurase
VAVTAHKMHGPLGIGALWTRAAVKPLFKGGGQERGQRGGTQPAVLAWAFAEAARVAAADTDACTRMAALRDALVAELLAVLPDATLTGEPPGPTRLPNNAHLCIPGLPSEPLINALAEVGLCASAGAACSTGKFRVSPTLQALGRRAEEGAFVRLTVGRFTRAAELPEAARRLAACVHALRPAYAGRLAPR